MAHSQPLTQPRVLRGSMPFPFQGSNQAPGRAAGCTKSCLTLPSGCVVGCVLVADHCIRLGTFLPLDDVELHIIALFQGLVSVQLN
jgi:hypothetical protein